MMNPYIEAIKQFYKPDQSKQLVSGQPTVSPLPQQAQPSVQQPAQTQQPVQAQQPAQLQPPTPTFTDPTARINEYIDVLSQRLAELMAEEAMLKYQPIEDPTLYPVPPMPPMVPPPAPTYVDPQLATLSSLATMFDPLGGGLYMGLPLAERERREKAELERWQALQRDVTQQFRDYLSGIKAINDLQVEIWKLKQTKAEDLYRARMQMIGNQKEQLQKMIADMMKASAELRTLTEYRQAQSAVDLFRAQTAASRLLAELPLIEARVGQTEAQAELAKARAQATSETLDLEKKLLEARIGLVDAQRRAIEARARELNEAIAARRREVQARGGSRLTPDDLVIREMLDLFSTAYTNREQTVQEYASKAFDLLDPEYQRRLNNSFSKSDEMMAELAYILYTETDGNIDLFRLIRTPETRLEKQEAAKREVARKLGVQQKVPPPPPPPPPPQKPVEKKAEPGLIQKIIGFFSSPQKPSTIPHVPPRPMQPPPSKQTTKQPAKPAAKTPAKPAEPVRRIKMTVTDEDFKRYRGKTNGTPIKILDVEVR